MAFLNVSFPFTTDFQVNTKTTTLAFLFISAVLLMLSYISTQNAGMIKNILVVTSIILFLWGMVELIFFFPLAAAFSLVSFLMTAIATMQIKNIRS